MSKTVILPTRECRGMRCVQIPQHLFGKKVNIQAHEIKNPKRGTDICDGHECDQTTAKGDIKFFSTSVDISNI